MLMTGLHSVCDLSCVSCHTVLGWRYVSRGERERGREGGREGGRTRGLLVCDWSYTSCRIVLGWRYVKGREEGMEMGIRRREGEKKEGGRKGHE